MGKSAHVTQGLTYLAWLPAGPDDPRPPEMGLIRQRRAKKLARRWIKCMAFMSTPATGPAPVVPMRIWWPHFGSQAP